MIQFKRLPCGTYTATAHNLTVDVWRLGGGQALYTVLNNLTGNYLAGGKADSLTEAFQLAGHACDWEEDFEMLGLMIETAEKQ